MSGYCHNSWEGREELGGAKDGGITWLGPEEGSFCWWGRDTWGQAGWQSVTRVTIQTRVTRVPHWSAPQLTNIIGPDSNSKYANKIITSSSSVSLSIISDGSFVHFLVSVALMIKKYFKSFYGVKIIYLHQVLEQGRRSYYPPISLSSVYIWCLGVRFSLPRCVFCIVYRCQV